MGIVLRLEVCHSEATVFESFLCINFLNFSVDSYLGNLWRISSVLSKVKVVQVGGTNLLLGNLKLFDILLGFHQ